MGNIASAVQQAIVTPIALTIKTFDTLLTSFQAIGTGMQEMKRIWESGLSGSGGTSMNINAILKAMGNDAPKSGEPVVPEYIPIRTASYIDPLPPNYVAPVYPAYQGIQRNFPWLSSFTPTSNTTPEFYYDEYQKTKIVPPSTYKCPKDYVNLYNGKCLASSNLGFTTLSTKVSNTQCVSVAGGATTDGTGIVSTACPTEPVPSHFQFSYNPITRLLKDKNSNKCVTKSADSSTTSIQICNEFNPYQQWDYNPLTQQLKILGGENQCLDVQNGTDTTNVVASTCTNDVQSQKFVTKTGENIVVNAVEEVTVVTQELPDFGKALGQFDATLTEIPWDSDNKSSLPKDIVWGFVPKSASLSIFSKVYHSNLLSRTGGLIDQDGQMPQYYSPVFNVEAKDPNDAARLQAMEGAIIIGGNMALQAGADELISRALSNNIKNAPSVKLTESITKVKKTLGADMKGKVGAQRLRQLMTNVRGAVEAALRRKIAAFTARFVAESAAVKGVTAGAAAAATATTAAVAATVVGAPAAAPLGTIAAALNAMATAINALMIAADILCVAINTIIPAILDKIMEPDGICPAGSKPLETFIPDELFFFVSNFVPVLGDVISVFSPYICFTGNSAVVAKEKLKTQPYYEDTTLSLYYHEWGPNKVPRGSRLLPTSSADPPGFRCQGAICYGGCKSVDFAGIPIANAADFRPVTDLDLVCWIKAQGRGWGRIPDKRPCASGERDDGVSCWSDLTCTTTSRFPEWDWTDGGFFSTRCSGKGGITQTLFDRQQCNADEEKNGLLCYPKCPAGMLGVGPVCWANAVLPFIPRDIRWRGNSRQYDEGFTPPPLESITEFAWCNFASPRMMDRMAQFYYDQALSSAIELEDGRLEFKYIVQFLGVIASSEFSCDVVCGMKTVRFDPITGANYEETFGCTNPDDPTNPRCYRRFYFMKQDKDDQGMFTVTGCTNADYSGVDAMSQVKTDGTCDGTCVTSVPKVLQVTEKLTAYEQSQRAGTTWERVQAGFNLTGSISAAIGVNLLGVVPGILSGSGSISVVQGVVSPLVQNALSDKLNALDASLSIRPLADPNCGTCVRGNRRQGFVIITDTDNYNAMKGPIVDIAAGYIPRITFCAKAVIQNKTCIHKDNVRDVILKYETANPTLRVKQIDAIEARGTNACYFKWKETPYNAATNMEGPSISDKEILMTYTIPDKSTCVFTPGTFSTDFNAFTIRSLTVPGLPNALYPTRIQTLDGNGKISYKPAYPTTPFLVPPPLPPATTLGGTKCPTRRCEDLDQASALLADFNKANPDKKIMKILRGWTSRVDRCDYEVDMLRVGTTDSVFLKETVSINVVESSSKACFFTRSSDGSAKINSGTFIQSNTPTEMNWTKPEVFFVGTDSIYSRAGAKDVCNAVGARVATYAEVVEAQRRGADWCKNGWVSDKSEFYYPITTTINAQCALSAGVQMRPNIGTGGVNCFGQKPATSPAIGILPFNAAKWRLEDEIKTSTKVGVSASAIKVNDVQTKLGQIIPTTLNINLESQLKTPVQTAVQEAQKVLDATYRDKPLAGCPSVTCANPAVLQNIMNTYNALSAAPAAYDTEKNTMKRIIKAGASGPTSCDVLFENLYEVYDSILEPPVESSVSLKVLTASLTSTGNCTFEVSDINSVEKSGAILSDGSTVTPPFRGTACTVDCLNPTLLTQLKTAVNSMGDPRELLNKAKSVTMSYGDGAKCEYLITKDVSTKSPYDGKWYKDTDIQTYITAAIQTTVNAAGVCTFAIDSIDEVDPSLLDYTVDPDTQRDVYTIDGDEINIPVLYTYDPTVKVSPKVVRETRSLL